MAEMISLTAADGFKLAGWRAAPAGKPIGGIVFFGNKNEVRLDLKNRPHTYASKRLIFN